MVGIRFFPFPSPANQKRRWIDLIRRENFVPGKFSRLCSLHFIDGKPTVLHPYPELFVYNNYKEVNASRENSSILKREKTHDYDSLSRSDNEIKEDRNKQATSRSYLRCLSIMNTLIQSLISQRFVTVRHEDLSMTDISGLEQMQFEHEKYKSSVKPLIDKYHFFTAILDKASPSLKYWRGHEGTHHDAKYQLESSTKKPGPSRNLSRYNEFLITLLKIKLALPSFLLADIFGILESRVSQFFSTWINFMNTVFTPLLKWPNSKKVRKHLPKSFRTTFPKTTCIIDCTEIFIQKPTTPSAQARTYSTYKQHNTYKMLVSITPTGAFNFVSNLWCGNVSDRYITEHSGFLDNIIAGDEVMADRGFLIRDLLLETKATLNIPPFTKIVLKEKADVFWLEILQKQNKNCYTENSW
ncbi:unnamed protein product [Mytilus coruscus]|uniref:THAP-type domain-containing protein n=1 Tax=Mytilus coruscus TaxID=42192 RepID=A0A6J8D9I6_MYTCO|nr:unnamed protein product [Mytilus coruscus]